MRYVKNILFVITVIVLLLVIIVFIINISNTANKDIYTFTIPKVSANYGGFIGGIYGAIFALLGSLFLFITIIHQIEEFSYNRIESTFIKLLDYHKQNISNMRCKKNIESNEEKYVYGTRCFVVFKSQLEKILSITIRMKNRLNIEMEDNTIINIAYKIFFYGLGKKSDSIVLSSIKKENQEFVLLLIKKLKSIKQKSKFKGLIRTNQTNLGHYYRNMYRAIKYIDTRKYLNKKEKREYIKLLRSQLSNPELLLLYYNVRSDFGKKWNEFICKYDLIKNIPENYCQHFEPREYFKEIGYE